MCQSVLDNMCYKSDLFRDRIEMQIISRRVVRYFKVVVWDEMMYFWGRLHVSIPLMLCTNYEYHKYKY